MKITRIYYPGLLVAFILTILNLLNICNVDLILVPILLAIGWVSIVEQYPSKESVVIWFPLIKKIKNKLIKIWKVI